MAMIEEIGTLINVREVNYVDKKTGDEKLGVSVSLLQPAQDAQFDGVGFRVLNIYESGKQGREKFRPLLSQAQELFLKKVKVQCDMQRRGNYTSLSPISISAA